MAGMNLDGHTALITGGAQGIGKEIALTLVENGANIVVVDINPVTLEAFELEMREKNREAEFLCCQADVSKVDDIDSAVEKATKKYGGIDILINNAGILHSTPIEDITEEEWDRIIDINLKSYFFAAQKVLPGMKKKNWGRIINMSSLAGRMGGYVNGLGYSASKAGIIGLSRGLAYRLAKYNITSNCIAPGTTESAILDQISDEKITEIRKKIPLGRLGKTEDIASLVLFLASEMSGFITGSTIDINGGMYMG